MEALAEFLKGQVIPSIPYIRVNDVVEVETQAGMMEYKVLAIDRTV